MTLSLTGPSTPPRRETIELAPRSDGTRYRRVTLHIEPGGALVLRSHDMGAAPEAAWGLDDDEVTLSVPAGQAGRLAPALAAELLAGGADAIARLADLCVARGVPHRLAHWT
ncbi:MAG TPA: hypothetical protein VG227_05905 [Caulobacteraceae bacterium]|jgi:hypothetical protein|nr:hypothetical protein [Caulobacteraceae bacterium]